MSTLRTNALEGVDAKNSITIVAGAGNITTTNIEQGLAKAWINFNGSGTIATADSFNHSSLTDHSTGQYSNTITSAMNNTSYSGSGNGGEPGSRDCHTMFPSSSALTTTVQRTRLAPSNSADGNHDATVVLISLLGDLA
tara:strand:+ start:320 stop:736 length:417 start_codon:yes stop_codon:yes gene_type:complete